MELSVWGAFVGASVALLALPGPVVMLLLGYTLGRGPRIAAAAVPGVVLGDFAAMTASLLGVGALLSASAELFFWLKIAGAVYLVWLGVGLWRRGGDLRPQATERHGDGWRAFRDAFLVTAFNPKDIMFFVAFLPQFIAADQPFLPQVLILEATFLGLVVLSNVLWILIGTTFAGWMRTGGRLRVASRIGAGWLIGAGALAALSR